MPKITKTESGSGGRLGHSNMAHWMTTHEVKTLARKARRQQDKLAAREDG